ncbi:hypothetical protein HAX54_046892, partial [Datura stramonium]|nr:hypothetical protein [Datura stramonium]
TIRGVIQPRKEKVVDPTHPLYDSSKRCAFHSNSQGHDTEESVALNHKNCIAKAPLTIEGQSSVLPTKRSIHQHSIQIENKDRRQSAYITGHKGFHLCNRTQGSPHEAVLLRRPFTFTIALPVGGLLHLQFPRQSEALYITIALPVGGPLHLKLPRYSEALYIYSCPASQRPLLYYSCPAKMVVFYYKFVSPVKGFPTLHLLLQPEAKL